VVQRVFVDVWQSAGRYDPARSLHAWVFTIAKRRVVDELRRRRHAVVPLDEFRDVVRDQENDVAAGYVDALTVRGMLGQLSPEQRTVLELAYFRGHTQAEIAARLDVPLGTVKARTARGLRRLAALLDDGESRWARTSATSWLRCWLAS
jgi:RNA polymerase sigma-70 factor (ECF subfamily)